ncbi:Nucleotidyltransferase domain-containing protein [Azotobacter beijerinckii]|uniref:Nucleotidyltransferase domain-containing protein n=1 Tax=Azotobacter beijerinckii TaxID=170623 RepID=A0A1H6YY70_9GAMM|nr:nucleotidyltransferase domain-containing protein [Azotobacter beijerinckii]SEJ46168.1 Nucleotidyltransferase domain-containing protein [Azotobacter beijerinckii]
MSILSLVIYGSRARNDHAPESDTDLFAITDDANYKMIVVGSTNIACYPRETALERAKSGELFFFHIVKEGTPIYDPGYEFDKLKNAFTPKNNYQKEIINATELGYALVDNTETIRNQALLNKRIAWCVRSILIAKTAELGSPIFSKKGLIKYANDHDITDLIDLKNSKAYSKSRYKMFYSFLSRHGSEHPKDMPKNFEDLITFFNEKKNEMGAKTVSMFLRDIVPEDYVAI